MATSNTSSGTDAQGVALWERLQGFMTRRRRETGDGKERKGLAITIATLVSTLLWFTFSMRETYSGLILLPTQVVNIPRNEALTQLPPPSVRVQVEAEGLDLIRLRLNPPTVRINGERDEIVLREAVAEVLQHVNLQSVSPSTFALQKERRITRKVPVALKADIRTPSGYDLIAGPTLAPDSVTISGAASIVLGIDAWPTRPYAVEDLRDSLATRILLSDTLDGLVLRDIQATTLTAVAQQFTEGVRELDVTVIGEPSSQRLVTLDPATVRVTYRVPVSQYTEAARAMDFFATVSFDEIRADTTGSVQPDIHPPEDLELRDLEWDPPMLRYYQRIE